MALAVKFLLLFFFDVEATEKNMACLVKMEELCIAWDCTHRGHDLFSFRKEKSKYGPKLYSWVAAFHYVI